MKEKVQYKRLFISFDFDKISRFCLYFKIDFSLNKSYLKIIARIMNFFGDFYGQFMDILGDLSVTSDSRLKDGLDYTVFGNFSFNLEYIILKRSSLEPNGVHRQERA